MLAILIIVPFLIAAFASIALREYEDKIKYVALAASLISLLLIIIVYSNANPIQATNWFSFSGYTFTLSTSTLPLNMILLFILGTITPLIIVYSFGFMSLPSEQSRYYFELCLFASAMMLFAMAGDFIVMFIGWELLGITSYLLIGFWYQREGTAAAARKAITTVLIGDILMLMAILIIWNSYHTFSFAAILSQSASPTYQTGGIGIALVLIMLAAFTKSAQFPFHEWLPDAMKGPTPVSAYLHSSTMVKAGVFLIAVLLPLFVAYKLLYLLIIFGIITAIIGITNALTEHNIKRVLAYSTIEDLGLMFIALGTGSIIAAMMLFVVQTFYKCLLFMSAGSMIKANKNEETMEKMYNSPSVLKLFIPTLIGVASLAGLFPLSGFFGKTAVALSAGNSALYILLLIIGFLSNVYIFRWLLLPLDKKNDRREASAHVNFKTLPQSMMIPIYILAALVFAASLAYLYLPQYLSAQTITIGTFDILLSSIVVVAGFVTAYWLYYYNTYSSISEKNPIYRVLHNNILVNWFYVTVAKLFQSASNVIDEFDHSLYEIIKQGAQAVNSSGNLIKKIQNGDTQTYAAAFVIGIIVILVLLIL